MEASHSDMLFRALVIAFCSPHPRIGRLALDGLPLRLFHVVANMCVRENRVPIIVNPCKYILWCQLGRVTRSLVFSAR